MYALACYPMNDMLVCMLVCLYVRIRMLVHTRAHIHIFYMFPMSEQLQHIIQYTTRLFWSMYVIRDNRDSPKKMIHDHMNDIIQKLYENGYDVESIDDCFFDNILPYSFYKSFLTSHELKDRDEVMRTISRAICALIIEDVVDPVPAWTYVPMAQQPFERKVHVSYNTNDNTRSSRRMTVAFELTPDNPMYAQYPMRENYGDPDNNLQFAYAYIHPRHSVTNNTNITSNTSNAINTSNTNPHTFTRSPIPEGAIVFTRDDLLRKTEEHLRQWL